MLQNRRIVWPSYLVAFSLSVIPPIDALMQTMPVRMSDTRWRWGAFGLLSNGMMIPMIGLLIAFVVSTQFEHRLFQRVLGVITGLAAVTALIGLGMFMLDSLQLHKDVTPAMAIAFKVACATATTKAIVGILTLAGFTWTAFSGPKRKVAATAPNTIVVAAPRKAAPVAPPAPIAAPSAVEVK